MNGPMYGKRDGGKTDIGIMVDQEGLLPLTTMRIIVAD